MIAQLALGVLRGDQLLDDLRHRVGVRTDGAGARRAAERAHAAHHQLRLLAGQQRHERLLERDQRLAAHDHLALLGEVERHDRDVLDVDVAPDVDLGPVRERKHADALARPDAGCSAGSRARAADSSDPTGRWRRGARRCAPWRATAPRRAARRRTPRRSCRLRARRAATWS